jgi:predicted nucleic acid-binding protein
MARYLIDTDTLIDFSKGWEPTRSKLLQLIDGGDVLGVCGINITEFYAGVPPESRGLWDEFFSALPYWGIGRETATVAGIRGYDLAREGRPITTADTLIAAVATEQHAIVLTSNTKDFPIQGLTVRSLRAED